MFKVWVLFHSCLNVSDNYIRFLLRINWHSGKMLFLIGSWTLKQWNLRKLWPLFCIALFHLCYHLWMLKKIWVCVKTIYHFSSWNYYEENNFEGRNIIIFWKNWIHKIFDIIFQSTFPILKGSWYINFLQFRKVNFKSYCFPWISRNWNILILNPGLLVAKLAQSYRFSIKKQNQLCLRTDSTK